MKLLDRAYEAIGQLVIENARLKEENEHLKRSFAAECAHSSQLREEINSLKDALKRKMQVRPVATPATLDD